MDGLALSISIGSSTRATQGAREQAKESAHQAIMRAYPPSRGSCMDAYAELA